MADGAETWIPAYRKLFEPDHHLRMNQPACPRFAWLDCCQMATRAERTVSYGYETIELGRGEFVASLRTLGGRWGWDKMKVSRFMDMLEKRDSVRRVRETPAGTVYVLVNAGVYWLDQDSGRDRGETAGETGVRQERDKNNTYKKEESNRYPPPADAVGGNYPPEFEAAWSAYPDRPNKNKRGAYRKWLATVNRGNDPDAILKGVVAYAAKCEAEHADPRFIKQPDTFFGPDEHWRTEWRATPANPTRPQQAQGRWIPGVA